MAYYPSGKFSSALAERLWNISLDGYHDVEAGDTKSIGWYARFACPTPGQSVTRNNRTLTYHGPAGFILNTDSQGFVDATTYDDRTSLTAAWSRILEACRSTVNDEPCDDCGSTDTPCWCAS